MCPSLRIVINMLLLDAESKRFTTTTSRKKHSLFSAKVRIIFELDDNNRKEIFAQTLKLIRINYKKLPYSEFLYKKRCLITSKMDHLILQKAMLSTK